MPGRVYCSEPMSRHTSFKIGGPADVLVQPENSEGLAFALAAAKDYEVPVTILGNGSNVLVRDKGIRGLVIQLGNALKSFRREGNRLFFGSRLFAGFGVTQSVGMRFKRHGICRGHSGKHWRRRLHECRCV